MTIPELLDRLKWRQGEARRMAHVLRFLPKDAAHQLSRAATFEEVINLIEEDEAAQQSYDQHAQGQGH